MKIFLIAISLISFCFLCPLVQASEVPPLSEKEAEALAKKTAEETEKLVEMIQNPKTSKKDLHKALKTLLVDKYYQMPNANSAGFKIMESGVKKVADAVYEIKKKPNQQNKFNQDNFMASLLIMQSEYPGLNEGLAEITRGALVVMRMDEKLEQSRRPLPRKEDKK